MLRLTLEDWDASLWILILGRIPGGPPCCIWRAPSALTLPRLHPSHLPLDCCLLSRLLLPNKALQLRSCSRHLPAGSSRFKSQLSSKFHPNLVLLSFGLKSFNDCIAHEVQMTLQWVRGPAWTVHGLHLGVSLATMNCMPFCKLSQYLCAFGFFSYTSHVFPLVHWLGRGLVSYLSRLN